MVPERKKAFISARIHFVNHQNTALNPETKKQASNRHIFKVLGRLTVPFFRGNPVFNSFD